MKRNLTLFLLLLLSTPLAAQFTISGFLSSATEDPRMAVYEAQLDYLGDHRYKTPWVNRTEFRTRSNDFNISQEDFRLRVMATNPYEIKANKVYHQNQTDLLYSQSQLGLVQALRNRYDLIIRYIHAKRSLSVEKQQESVYRDQLTVYSQAVGTSMFDIDDLLEAEEDLTQTQLKVRSGEHDLIRLEELIRFSYDFQGDIVWEEGQLMDLAGIKAILDREIPAGMENTIYAEVAEKEKLLADQRLVLEKAESKRRIGFFQAEYDIDRGNETKEHLGYQIGVRIPIFNPDKPDLERRELDMVGEEQEQQRRATAYEMEQQAVYRDLQHLVDQYDFLDQTLAELTTRFPTSDPDPLLLLKSQERVLGLEQDKHRLSETIYREYVHYLDLTGRLGEGQLRNWLSRGLEEL